MDLSEAVHLKNADNLEQLAPSVEVLLRPSDIIAAATTTTTEAYQSDGSFLSAFIATFSMIVVSELGDKTFFIAALLAMRYSRLVVYAGAMISLALMHALSALLGYSATVIPRRFTQIAAAVLFAAFGIHQLREASQMAATPPPDLIDPKLSTSEVDDVESGLTGSSPTTSKWNILRRVSLLRRCLSPVFIEAFVLTFLAEWGDRSQITTVVLAARGEDLIGVLAGGIVGHGLCTALAVIGGRAVAQVISPRTVTYIGGVTFLIFAVTTLLINV